MFFLSRQIDIISSMRFFSRNVVFIVIVGNLLVLVFQLLGMKGRIVSVEIKVVMELSVLSIFSFLFQKFSSSNELKVYLVVLRRMVVLWMFSIGMVQKISGLCLISGVNVVILEGNYLLYLNQVKMIIIVVWSRWQLRFFFSKLDLVRSWRSEFMVFFLWVGCGMLCCVNWVVEVVFCLIGCVVVMNLLYEGVLWVRMLIVLKKCLNVLFV